jgi:rod shape-determining protein MreD
MTDYSNPRMLDHRDKDSVSKYSPIVVVLVMAASIAFWVYVPMFLPYLAYLELPLLVTVYFSLMKHNQILGTLSGAAIGLVQDALAISQHPLGMYGISKTLVGYFASSLSLRFDVDNQALRFFVVLFFFFFHALMYWMLTSALLAQTAAFAFVETSMTALLNAFTAVPLFLLLDKLKQRP